MEKVIYTTCARDCPDNCGMLAYVKDGRVIKLKGHPDHELTRGYLCAKASRFLERVYSHERQLYPLRRKNDRLDSPWERVSWDEALDLVAGKIRHYIDTYGSLSIVHYQRSGSWGISRLLSQRFWNLLGGVTTNSGSLCAGAARAGQVLDFGARIGHDPIDLLNSRLVFLWGRNPMVTSIHLMPLLKEVRRRGGKVVLIDPVRSESADFCDRHVQPRVATDAELAMAMAKVILEEGLEDRSFIERFTYGFTEYRALIDAYSLSDLCRTCELSEDDVRSLARQYATTKPAAIFLGWAINKYQHSAEIFRFVDALAALCGHIGVAGGGVTHGYDTKRHIDKKLFAADRARSHRTIPEPLLGRGLIEAQQPPVRMIFVNATNPVTQCPNSNLVARAFAALDFVVVADQFLTDTTDYAHVFLPTTTFLEEDDVVISWGHNIIGGVNQVIEPLGEARSDLWIYQQLAERLGIGVEMAGTTREWLKRMLLPLEQNGVTVEQVFEGPVRCPIAPMVPFADKVFPTKSGKFEFITAFHRKSHITPDFPLTLVTHMSRDRILSQLLEKEHPKMESARIGMETAREYGIETGEKVIIRSPAGRLEVKMIVDPRVGRGMVVMPVGTWVKRGGGPNLLTEDIMSNFGQMAAYYETRVRIERLDSLGMPTGL